MDDAHPSAAWQLRSWSANADAWAEAIGKGSIESRRVTSQAIVEAVVALQPRRVLDVGCGEGWLIRALAEHGIEGTGIDATEGLVRHARAAGAGDFRVVSYADVVRGVVDDVRADVVVSNFALADDEGTERLVRHLPRLLAPGGGIVIQTVHPAEVTRDAPYRSGWRSGSWEGFSDAFVDPAPWYFRTLSDWVALFERADLCLTHLREPTHPDSGRPMSVVFHLAPRADLLGV